MRPLLLVLALASPAAAQCGYRHATYAVPYVAPTYTYTYPYHDNSFNVTYHLTFPPPTVAGSTVYGNVPGGLSLFDAGEAYKLKVAAGQRLAEQGAALVQSADVILQQSVQSNGSEQKLRALESLERILNSKTEAYSAIQTTRVGPGQLVANAAAGAGHDGSPQGIVTAKCTRCHGNGRTEKGLDLRNLTTLPEGKAGLVLERILSDDPSVRMPPPSEGVRAALTPQEKLALIAGAIGGGEKQQDTPPLKQPGAKKE